MEVISTKNIDRKVVTDFFIKHWGSPEMVISSGTFQCDELDGLAVLDEYGEIAGLITFILDEKECEIISLDSVVENKGVGTQLVNQVEIIAREKRCRHMKLVTTNDNVHALGFYQRRGYRLIEVYPHAVDKARQVKPEIPEVASNGIPIRDELVLKKRLLEGALSMNEENCILCDLSLDPAQRIILENETCVYVQKGSEQEVLEGSGLIIPKEHKENVFELNETEWADTQDLLHNVKSLIDEVHSPEGYSVGWNTGKVGGQSIPHAHLHVIPRFADEPYAGKGIRHWIKQPENRRQLK